MERRLHIITETTLDRTTQPKFVPNEAVKINLNNIDMRVRLIDCVGYMINGALGQSEGDKPRLVKTPWSNKEMPFEDAAEIGTKKVIEEHSTIAVLLTTDGTISDIPRSNYVVSEERVASELIAQNKPFIVIVNSTTPNSPEAVNLANTLSQKYGTLRKPKLKKTSCIPLFIAALFTIARTWKQHRCPSTDEWIKKCGTYSQWNITQP